MLKKQLLVLAFSAATIFSTAAHAQSVLVNPTDDTLCLLYYHFAGQTPAFDQLAQNDPSVENANEFDKPAALAAQTQKLKSFYDSLASVKTVKINIDMSLGTYDSQQGEYDLSGFAGDEYLSYYCFNSIRLQLQFDNSDYAQSWTLTLDAAEAVLDKNGGGRDVVAISTIELTGVNPGAPGDPLVLVGDVKKVDVIGEFNNVPLGHYTVATQ